MPFLAFLEAILLIAPSKQGMQASLGFWIPVVNGIPDSLLCIRDSKSQDSGFYKQNFPRFRNPDSLTWGDTEKCFDLLKLKGILSITKKKMRNRGKINSC